MNPVETPIRSNGTTTPISPVAAGNIRAGTSPARPPCAFRKINEK
jgi:hypothetical protein